MDDPLRRSSRAVLVVVALAVAGIGIWGIHDLRVLPYWGFGTTGGRVSSVTAGGPAERAGFQVGDSLLLDGGIDPRDVRLLNQRPWPRIGDGRSYLLRRGNQTAEATLVFSRMPSYDIRFYGTKAVIGVLFLVTGLVVLLGAGGGAAAPFSLLCDSAGVAMMTEPYLATVVLERLWLLFYLAWIGAGFAFLFHFTSVFPRVKRWSERHWFVPLAYTPAALALLALLPVLYSGAAAPRVLTAAILLVPVAYLGASVALLVRDYALSGRDERRALGLDVMLAGSVLAFVPMIVALLFMLAAPSVQLPGRPYYPFTLALLVASFAYACLRQRAAPRLASPA